MNYDLITRHKQHNFCLSGPNVIQDLKYCGRAFCKYQGNAKLHIFLINRTVGCLNKFSVRLKDQ